MGPAQRIERQEALLRAWKQIGKFDPSRPLRPWLLSITANLVRNRRRSAGHWTIEMGAPNLSKFTASPQALHLRLKDPASVKSDTKMPDLGLSEAEIESLISFINTK